MLVKFKPKGRNALQYIAVKDMHGDVIVHRCTKHRDDPELLRVVLYINDTQSYTIHGECNQGVLLFCHSLYNIKVNAGDTMTVYMMDYNNNTLSSHRSLELSYTTTPSTTINNPIQTVVLGKKSGDMMVSYHHEWSVLHSVIFDDVMTTLMLNYPTPYRLTIRHIKVNGRTCYLMVQTGRDTVRYHINQIESFTVDQSQPRLTLLDQNYHPLPWGDNWLIIATID